MSAPVSGSVTKMSLCDSPPPLVVMLSSRPPAAINSQTEALSSIAFSGMLLLPVVPVQFTSQISTCCWQEQKDAERYATQNSESVSFEVLTAQSRPAPPPGVVRRFVAHTDADRKLQRG
ncbi:hypothetical protein Pelo_19952 [Pelomyxa schiedti]|nr:hypothetical protein Pelo_19952 [Pelomyxa schiedti]